MRKLIAALLVAGALGAVASLVGCPAAHDDYPGASCKTDSDCYQGEKCMNASVCVPVTPVQDLAAPPGSDLSSTDMAQSSMDDMTAVDM